MYTPLAAKVTMASAMWIARWKGLPFLCRSSNAGNSARISARRASERGCTRGVLAGGTFLSPCFASGSRHREEHGTGTLWRARSAPTPRAHTSSNAVLALQHRAHANEGAVGVESIGSGSHPRGLRWHRHRGRRRRRRDGGGDGGGVACGTTTCGAGETCCAGCHGDSFCSGPGGACPGLDCAVEGGPPPPDAPADSPSDATGDAPEGGGCHTTADCSMFGYCASPEDRPARAFA